MKDAAPADRPVKWHRHTSWSELGYEESADHFTGARFVLARDESETDCPKISKVHFPAGHRVEPHMHLVGYAEIVLEGSLRVGRTWHAPGDIRIVGPNTAYGPQEAGPDGVTLLIVFDGTDTMHVDLQGNRPESAAIPTGT
jgi:hypothetical protein